MSPVSRGRKPKKSKKRSSGRSGSGPARSALPRLGPTAKDAVEQMLARANEMPGWFAPATEAVLKEADNVLTAEGPRALEEATVRLLGEQLRRAVRESFSGYFDWWVAELTDALAGRVRDELARGGVGWEGPLRLLYGLTSVGTPSLAARAVEMVRSLEREVGRVSAQPGWLEELAGVAGTGEVWTMRDAYGTRLAVIAGFAYPDVTDPSTFLFDVDACGAITIVNVGVYDDPTQAAAAWRVLAGESADDAELRSVETSDDLLCLVYADRSEMFMTGAESDSVLDNWFRTTRRLHDLATASDQRGLALPEAKSLFGDIDEAPAAAAFTAWHTVRHGHPPNAEAVDALALEWLEGCLPGAEHAASPHRVRYLQELTGDWIEDQITAAAEALLPDWVRWNCEQAGVTERLTALSAAAAGQREPYSRGGTSCTP